jgi:RimJ/RimL family protein N-acetyltransferase
MDHDISVDGLAFGLRPIRIEDAAFVVQLRTSNPNKTRFVHPISGVVSDQERWIAQYFVRLNDYYFVVHRLADGRPQGVVGIYDVEPVAQRAEWGRWVLRDGSMASVETLLLVYRAAFMTLGLRELYCDTNAENKSVVSFHDSVGVRKVGLIERRFFFKERHFDATRHSCTYAEWPALEARLISLATPIARRLAARP